MVRKKRKKKKKTIASLKRIARGHFQRYIRYKYFNENDIVECVYGCGKVLEDPKKCDGAHYLKAELYADATFDEDNVWPSCKGCNIRDPLLEYRKNLIKRHGEEWLNRLENKYELHKGTYKWDHKYLNEIISKYKSLSKQEKNKYDKK